MFDDLMLSDEPYASRKLYQLSWEALVNRPAHLQFWLEPVSKSLTVACEEQGECVAPKTSFGHIPCQTTVVPTPSEFKMQRGGKSALIIATRLCHGRALGEYEQTLICYAWHDGTALRNCILGIIPVESKLRKTDG
jgi:hypothetical protein